VSSLDAYLGEIRTTGFGFAPAGWALCAGQILPITQHTALFSLLGVNYGGNGTTTFALPDLQQAVPVGQGQGTGLTPRTIGEEFGTSTVTLGQAQMPAHAHPLNARKDPADLQTPGPNRAMARSTSGFAYAATPPDTVLYVNAVQAAGGSLPHQNMQASLVVNFIICLSGMYPPRQ
jgi:microcystin-dependent protein